MHLCNSRGQQNGQNADQGILNNVFLQQDKRHAHHKHTDYNKTKIMLTTKSGSVSQSSSSEACVVTLTLVPAAAFHMIACQYLHHTITEY